MQELTTLDKLRKNTLARIIKVQPDNDSHDDTLEQRLLAMGFVEDAMVTVAHHNWLGRDPIVVEIAQGATVALRKSEARAVCIQTLR